MPVDYVTPLGDDRWSLDALSSRKRGAVARATLG